MLTHIAHVARHSPMAHTSFLGGNGGTTHLSRAAGGLGVAEGEEECATVAARGAEDAQPIVVFHKRAGNFFDTLSRKRLT